MTISSGTRLGPYEVVAPLGAGGMGEVWKARDTRLDRSVAIKVLPAEFAENAQLKLRFEREAKTISQLNHPHICTLYDVGDGYLVMELLEGESLADKLAKGPLPVDQVLRYGIQIADALDKAHKAGVVHRDLKPANIMITKAGAKLLDFGLAKPNETGVLSTLTSLRTEQKNTLTEEGTIVGTFQYMAPEQIEGGNVDARTDIFALGMVLYEMASGRRAFAGKTKASLIASILTAEPQPISAVQPMAPATFDRVVRKCLEKEPDDRWQSAHDVATALRWVTDTPAPSVQTRRRDWKAWSIAVALLIATATFALLWYRATSTPKQRMLAFLLPPDGFEFYLPVGAPALSPDGMQIAFATRSKTDAKLHLFVQRVADGSQRELGQNIYMPFWSPDGRNVGAFSPVDHKVLRISAAGGPPQLVCDIPSDGRGGGGSWNEKGVIIFSTGRTNQPLYRVSAAGGAPAAATKVEAGDGGHRWPSFFPDGNHFLYSAQGVNAKIYVGALDSAERKAVVDSAYPALYSSTGHLVYCRGRALVAQPFDIKRFELKDEATVLTDSVYQFPLASSSAFSVANNGALLYQQGYAARSELTWRDRTGKQIGTIGEAADYQRPELSRDGHRVAYEIISADGTADIWINDVERNNPTRLTFEQGSETNAVWSPDGQSIVYSATDPKTGARTVMRRLSSGSGSPEKLFDGPNVSALTDWSSDGRYLFFHDGADVWVHSLVDGKTTPIVNTPFGDCCGRLSPDGHLLAYGSDKSGRSEVYVQQFPVVTSIVKVSTVGGSQPRWSSQGREIVYDAPDHTIMTADIRVTPGGIEAGVPKPLFHYRSKGGGWPYDVTADGQHFVVNESVADSAVVPLTLVMNWNADTKR